MFAMYSYIMTDNRFGREKVRSKQATAPPKILIMPLVRCTSRKQQLVVDNMIYWLRKVYEYRLPIAAGNVQLLHIIVTLARICV